jgi:Domain of unknown function (DUF4382)
MKTTRILFWVAYLAITTMTFSSCKKDKGNSRLNVYLTDAPAAYDAVNIDVVKVEIKSTDDQSDNGWQELTDAKAGIYNLLDFRNGMDALLASVELPAGKVSQLRLILGSNNSVVISGNTLPLPLETPSAQQSGLKFNIHADLVEGVTYKVWIDFDAARSVVTTGSNNYVLKPVVRTFTEATSGAIKGIALPSAAAPIASAISGADTLSAIPDATTGQYLIRGVPAGTWKVLLDGSNGYNDSTINNVNVVLGQVSDVGTITLTQ